MRSYAPIPEVRMMREVFAFESTARLGVMEVVLRECGAGSGWGRIGGAIELSNVTKACVLRSHVGETVAGLWHARQAAAARRTEAESEAYVEGMRRVSMCSEFMLRSGAGVWRSSRYAANLEAWLQFFPLSQLKVVATEALERDAAAVLAGVLTFLGLPPLAPAGAAGARGGARAVLTSPRYCVAGKRGVLEEAAGSRGWRAGWLDGSSDEDGDGGDGIGECATPRDKVVGPDGVGRYKIDAATDALLRKFFAPYNQKLFALLGREVEW